MSGLGVIEDTLFVPMLGRIYVSEHFPHILFDGKALELKERLPSGLLEKEVRNQSQYTLLASASRSASMDRHIRAFLERRPDGVIVQLGCGLETACCRCDNGKARWYAVDLPHVVEYRKKLLPMPERETCLAQDAFEEGWIRQIRAELPDVPVLVTAGGLFHYFEEARVLGLFQILSRFGETEVVFDAVNRAGMSMMRRKYMKQVGHADAQMFFWVDSASELAAKAGGGIKIISDEPYYRYISREGLRFSTKLSMEISDRLGMVRMIHLKC